MDNYQQYLDPQTLAKIKDLELQARLIVEGLVSGTHKSPYQGVSIEFAEHREYVPGDDIRHIDWKLYGKTNKFYLKRYEQETNLVCNVILDTSESMKYRSGEFSKLEYGARLAAAISYLVLHQQDSIGTVLFEDKIRYLVPPSSQLSHLKQILHLLAVCQPANVKSRVGAVLNELADRFRKRSVVVLVSDCFDEVDAIISGLRHLRYKRHEVVLFHVVDPAEIDFDFKDVTLFRGLESLPEILADPRGLRKTYQKIFGDYLKQILVACRSENVDYQLLRTDEPLDRALSTYLVSRGRKGRLNVS
ncbi:MAG: DUF58 domain-containing protein [Planctomycetota bacterium]